MRETAKKFWQESKEYPPYGDIKARRYHEIKYLVPKLKEYKIVLDLGCGDGALIRCLRELTEIKKFYAFDFSYNLVKDLINVPDVEVSIYDCYNPEPLPEVDAVVMAGLLQYLDEPAAEKMLSFIKAPLYLRTACAMEGEDVAIDKVSEKLGRQYASIYRTPRHTTDLLQKFFKIQEIKYIYPPHLDSKFGTRQLYYYCLPKQ